MYNMMLHVSENKVTPMFTYNSVTPMVTYNSDNPTIMKLQTHRHEEHITSTPLVTGTPPVNSIMDTHKPQEGSNVQANTSRQCMGPAENHDFIFKHLFGLDGYGISQTRVSRLYTCSKIEILRTLSSLQCEIKETETQHLYKCIHRTGFWIYIYITVKPELDIEMMNKQINELQVNVVSVIKAYNETKTMRDILQGEKNTLEHQFQKLIEDNEAMNKLLGALEHEHASKKRRSL